MMPYNLDNGETVIGMPPGIGDLHWIMAKLESFKEKNKIEKIKVRMNLGHEENTHFHDCSLEYLDLIPFVDSCESVLEEIPFDPTAHTSPEATDDEVMALMYGATWFDLPGYFIIASDEHPFYLYDPAGALKGAYVDWCTYLGALTYLYTDGDVKGSFLRVFRDSPSLYRQALAEILAAWEAARCLSR